MIIETRSDVLRLSGALHKNQWPSIKAAANLLIQDYPQGIIVDCADLSDISQEGPKTFLEAMRDIESAHARILVANLPPNVLSVLKTIPGVRSQLPIAESVEAARQSLRATPRTALAGQTGDRRPTGQAGGTILVPLMDGVDLTYGATLAARIAKATRADVRLTYFIEVTRTLPLNAPLAEQENAAQSALAQATNDAQRLGIGVTPHVERVREAIDGILQTIKMYQAAQVVVGTMTHGHDHGDNDRFHEVVDTLLHRAPCEVIIGRLKLPDN